jgi:hypothetical protein
MQIPILNGIFTDTNPDFRTAYPHNLVPVPKQQGISAGYLRPADGLVEFSAGVGADRGAIEWGGVCYRVQGTSLIKVDSAGVITAIGDVGTGGPVTFDYSFDYLAVASGGRLYLYDGTTLTQNTDPDLGTVLSFIWIDGYFLTTDGENLVITELGNPFAVNPLKYGSSEIDPDPINSVLELRNEVYAINTHSIEVFDNVGGTGFPFQRIEGAQIQKGSVGAHASVVYDKKIAFVGNERNEPPAVYVAINGQDEKISTREIDTILQDYTSAQIADIVLEIRKDKTHNWLYLHLPDQTLVYDVEASKALQQSVWFTLSGGILTKTKYPARSFIWVYDKWIAGDPDSGKIAEVSLGISTQFGAEVKWEFNVGILYNEGRGAIIHDMELVCLTGEIALGVDPVVTTQYSIDGLTWSQSMTTPAGKQGERANRVSWRRQGSMRNWRTQRFWGTTDAHITVIRLEARIEGLAF